LSVSTDRIALPAMRAMALLHRHGEADKSGDGKFFQVYPAGSLFLLAVAVSQLQKNRLPLLWRAPDILTLLASLCRSSRAAITGHG